MKALEGLTKSAHVRELRVRLGRVVLAVATSTALCWFFRKTLLALLLKPYQSAWTQRGMPGLPELQTLAPADVFVGYFHLSVVAGLILSAPVMLFEIWGFLKPGLYPRERRFVTPSAAVSSALFLAGAAFGYKVICPFSIDYFLSLLGQVDGTLLTQRPTLLAYLEFMTNLVLISGLVFELPLVIWILVLLGLVTPRKLVKFSRWALLLSFVVGAVVTPGPEMSSQIAVSVVLLALYALATAVAFFLPVGGRNAAKPLDLEQQASSHH